LSEEDLKELENLDLSGVEDLGGDEAKPETEKSKGATAAE
jgi:hypothetical protein